MASVPAITLNNGVEIPQLGFGTFQIPPQETRETTLAALKAGYRHIDTAQMYGNEEEVGEAVRDSGLDRGDVFVTSKLDNGAHAYDDALRAFEGTMEKIPLDYLDLFLIHWPLPDRGDFVETWKALEEIYRSGRVKSIGVSNFQPHHLRRLLDGSVVVPAVNQIEVHPYLTQDAVRSFGAEQGIATEAWSPIAQGKVLDDPTLVRIAERVGKSTAQVTLRWHLQRGDIVFPKSVTRRRIEENFDLFDFELTEGDIGEINALNRDERTGLDPDRFNG
ncbi:aldo/keto reductase [Streptomyces sp. NPDC048209]|uniref:aldo/keto reductase n=1 Tax=unclassified Streptomyces TaxID=2593676 RepID=UPI0023FA16C2|nr:aldo/keto reductase [Streptomyces sp. JH010]MDF6066380.1 aldo/keto reductase [Streptomyces sp. JH010]